jgi:hypothetical protein
MARTLPRPVPRGASVLGDGEDTDPASAARVQSGGREEELVPVSFATFAILCVRS